MTETHFGIIFKVSSRKGALVLALNSNGSLDTYTVYYVEGLSAIADM
jgi:hypothetical protein